MKNLVKTEFDSLYEELDILGEAIFQPSLFPTEDYISYEQLENYFNTYYFNAGKETLLPPVNDNAGWEIVGYLKNIESNIMITKPFGYSAFARICLFYNTYVVEHFLLNNVVEKDHRFAPDINKPDDDDFMYLPSHEFLRGGNGYEGADFIYTIKDRNVTADLKFKPSAKYLKKIETWNAHGADYVYCYAVDDNKLFLYKRIEFLPNSTVEAKYERIDSSTKDLEKTLPDKLIPQSLLKDPLYNHWANVFNARRLYLKNNKE